MINTEGLEDLVPDMGGCVATDLITVEHKPVGYMYREQPEHNLDTGWRFLTGTEDDDYLENPRHSGFYDVNTIANFDKAIIAYLEYPIGSELERVPDSDTFRPIEY